MSGAAEALLPLVRHLCGGDPPLRMRFWDGSELGPASGPTVAASDRDPATSDGATVVFSSPNAVRRILWMPNELGLARGYVAGEIGVEGDIYSLFRLQALLSPADRPSGWRARLEGGRLLLAAARATGALGPPLQPPAEEARLRGARHSRARDAQAIAHHYDVSNDFYRLFLGETMTYSCAYFATPETPLADAQRGEVRPDLPQARPAAGHATPRCRLRLGRHGHARRRALRRAGGRRDAVAAPGRVRAQTRSRTPASATASRSASRTTGTSLTAPSTPSRASGCSNTSAPHVSATYFGRLHALLRPGGRLLNHGICRPRGSRGLSRTSFTDRYVFPDGELHEVGIVAQAMQGRGFEVRDTQSLREHYALTLRHWVRNLEDDWDEAVRLAGGGRARVWRLYMAGSAENFAHGKTTVHQVLAVRPRTDGASDMPLTREALLG